MFFKLAARVIARSQAERAPRAAPIESLWQDLRFAARALARSPGFAAAGIVTLALGIGANTAIFTLINAVWLRPLPVAEPERLAVFYQRILVFTQPGAAPTFKASDGNGWRAFEALGDGSPAFVSVAAEGYSPLEARRPQLPLPNGAPLAAMPVSWNYFQALGVPVHGRTFVRDDDLPGAPVVAIISDRLWRARFNADANLIGQTVRAGTTPVLIIGIAAPRFRGPRLGDRTDVWLPLTAAGAFLPSTPREAFLRAKQSVMPVRLYGRLRAGVTLAQAEAEARAADQARPPRLFLRTLAATAYPTLAQEREGEDRRLTGLLAATAILVLVIGCANLASLLVARAERRRHEIAVRLALGVSRARLVGLLASEAFLLAASGAVAALLVSRLFLRTLAMFTLPTGIPIADLDLALDWRIAAFTSAVTMLTVAVCGLAPAWWAARADIMRMLAPARHGGGRSSSSLRMALLSAHVAIALVLLIGAALFTGSVRNALNKDLGFAADRTAFLAVIPNWARYADPAFKDVDFARRRADYARLQDRLRAVAGVTAVTAGGMPLMNPLREGERQASRAVVSEGRSHHLALAVMTGGPSLCAALGVPLMAGRDLDQHDTFANASGVAVVSKAFAQAMWPGENPVGKTFSTPSRDAPPGAAKPGPAGSPAAPAGAGRPGVAVSPVAAPSSQPDEIEVVGVASDSARRGVHGPGLLTIYRPDVTDPDLSQDVGRPSLGLVIRTGVDPSRIVPQITAVAREVFPDAYQLTVTTARQQIADEMASERMGATLFTWFSIVAVALGLVGVWGLVAYLVGRRLYELGVRLALGATPRGLMTVMALRGLIPVAVGCLIGLGAAAATMQLVGHYLFEITPVDPLTYAASAALFLLTAAIATIVPARRVLRLDPVTVLRSE